MAVGLVIIFLICTNIFQYVPFVYNKLYLKQVYGNFPGSIHNKQSAEISSVMKKKTRFCRCKRTNMWIHNVSKCNKVNSCLQRFCHPWPWSNFDFIGICMWARNFGSPRRFLVPCSIYLLYYLCILSLIHPHPHLLHHLHLVRMTKEIPTRKFQMQMTISKVKLNLHTVCLFVYLSVWVFVCLCFCLFVDLSVCVFVL